MNPGHGREPGTGTPAEAYEELGFDHDWLHPADAADVGTLDPVQRWFLRGLSVGASVLDAACGTGIDAVVLARQGYRVSASDSSPTMLAATRRRCCDAGVELTVRRADWRSMSHAFAPGGFDAVMCTGNSIAHLDGSAMGDAFDGFARLLAPGGLLMLDTHHWEEVVAAGGRIVRDRDVAERDGVRCARSYQWQVPHDAAWPSVCRLRIRLELASGTRTRISAAEVSFVPFRIATLFGRLRHAGLEVVHCDARAGSDRYTVVARRSDAIASTHLTS